MKIGFERVLSVIVVALVLLWIGSGMLFKKKHDVDVDVHYDNLSIPKVKIKNVALAKKQIFTKVYGIIHSDNVVTIKAETSGKVVNIFLKDGSLIKKNDVILEIDNRKQKHALERARTLLTQREIEYASEKELMEKNYSSRLKLASALANLKEAEQMLMNADVDLQSTFIKSNLDGILDKIYYNVGDVAILYSPIAKIYTSGDYTAYTFVSEKQILDIKYGDDVDVTLPSNKIYKGNVKFISTIAEPETRTYRVEVAFKAEESVTLGMSVMLNLPMHDTYAYFVDNNALFLDDSGMLCIKIINDDDRVKFVPAKILDESDGGFWIKAEIRDKDVIRIITLGGNVVKDGEKVSF